MVMSVTPEERYAAIAERIVAEDSDVVYESVAVKRMFGMNGGLKIAGKLFAFLAKGRLIVKLPRARVDGLVAREHGERCQMGKGRTMKEWIAVGAEREADWPDLIAEAKSYVAALTQGQSD